MGKAVRLVVVIAAVLLVGSIEAGQDAGGKLSWKLKQGDKLTLSFRGKLDVSASGEKGTSLRYSGKADIVIEAVVAGQARGRIELRELSLSGSFAGFPARMNYRRPENRPDPGDEAKPGPKPKVERAPNPDKGAEKAGEPKIGAVKEPPGRARPIDLPALYCSFAELEAIVQMGALRYGGTHLVLKALFTDLWERLPGKQLSGGDTWSTDIMLPVPGKKGMAEWKSFRTAARVVNADDSVAGESCVTFSQTYESPRKEKNKFKTSRSTSFGTTAGICLKVYEKAETKISKAQEGLNKGTVKFERTVYLSR